MKMLCIIIYLGILILTTTFAFAWYTPIAYYTFDNETGGSLNDSGGNNLNLAGSPVSTSAYQTGVSAMLKNCSNWSAAGLERAFINLTTWSPNIATIDYWFKERDLTANQVTGVSLAGVINVDSYFNEIDHANGNATEYMYMNMGGVNCTSVAQGNMGVALANVWHHVVLTNYGGGKIIMYLDTVNNMNCTTAVGGGKLPYGLNLVVGNLRNTGGYYFADSCVDNLFITASNYSNYDVNYSYNNRSGQNFNIKDVNITAPLTTSPYTATGALNMVLNFTFKEGNGTTYVTSGIDVVNVSVGGVSASILTSSDILRIRVGNDTSKTSISTIFFNSFGSTNYTVFGTHNLAAMEAIWSIKYDRNNATAINFTKEGSASGISQNQYAYYMIFNNDSYTINDSIVNCGTNYNVSTGGFATITFKKPYPDTEYSMLCNAITDQDSPLCGVRISASKSSTSVHLEVEDDGGADEPVNEISYCAFDRGEYVYNNISFKVSNSTHNSGVNVTYTTPFPNTDYAVFITNMEDSTDDFCACAVLSKKTNGFNASCADDGGSITNCNAEVFDWVAISYTQTNDTILTSQKQLSYQNNFWSVNVTLPNLIDGTYNLLLNANNTFYGVNDTDVESQSIIYSSGGGVPAILNCSPSSNEDWLISNFLQCNNTNINIGTGTLILEKQLVLYDSNFTGHNMTIRYANFSNGDKALNLSYSSTNMSQPLKFNLTGAAP